MSAGVVVSAPRHLEIIPLGGLGEFGMNHMVIRYGKDCLVVDAGMMFPGAEHLGVDVVIPNMEFLDACGTLHGVLLTHGHEDHVGALPFLLARHDVPVFSLPYTLGLVRGRLSEHDIGPRPALRPLPGDGEFLELGPFRIETVPVTHSIPHSVLLVLHTPVGAVVHTADFKLDPFPIDGRGTDLRRLSKLGEQGVLALLSDSTNARRAGFTPGERTVAPVLDGLIATAPGRVFVTTFASNVHRIQQIVDVAARRGRRVSLVGSSMLTHADLAGDLGLLRFPSGCRVDPETAMDLAPDRSLFLVTGSQGEPASAMARIAVDKHKEVAIRSDDLVIHSTRTIPGNEKSVGRMIDHLLRRGARVVTEQEAPVHVSGHASAEELRLMLHLIRPRFLLPIHGEHAQLAAHAALARQCGLEAERIVVADSGDVLALDAASLRAVDRVPVGQVFIDATLDEVDLGVLLERRQIAGDGIVVAVVAVDRESGSVNGPPEIASRGFVAEPGGEEILREVQQAVARALADLSLEERSDEGLLKACVQTEVKRFLRRRTQKRPLIIPVIVEL